MFIFEILIFSVVVTSGILMFAFKSVDNSLRLLAIAFILQIIRELFSDRDWVDIGIALFGIFILWLYTRKSKPKHPKRYNVTL